MKGIIKSNTLFEKSVLENSNHRGKCVLRLVNCKGYKDFSDGKYVAFSVSDVPQSLDDSEFKIKFDLSVSIFKGLDYQYDSQIINFRDSEGNEIDIIEFNIYVDEFTFYIKLNRDIDFDVDKLSLGFKSL